MVAHHEGAIEMAEQVARPPMISRSQALAEAIIAAQAQEIERMRGLQAG